MKIRILKEVLNSQQPTSLEKENLSISKSARNLAIAQTKEAAEKDKARKQNQLVELYKDWCEEVKDWNK